MKLVCFVSDFAIFELEFTPLEFETGDIVNIIKDSKKLEFTPLEFETSQISALCRRISALEFTPLEFETVDNSKNKETKE